VESIRRNSRTLARVLLPLLAVAWLSAAAAPCARMGLPPDVDDRAHADQLRAPSEAHFAMHDHGDCPHCPPRGVSQQGSAPSAHAACDETEGTRDNRENVLAKWDLKHALPVSSRPSSEPSFRPPGFQCPLNHVLPTAARVPLNIRYCIYLI
jgi:hypothetical protein